MQDTAITFSPNRWEDYSYWIENDDLITGKINNLIKEIMKTPFEGLGDPKSFSSNLWFRKITEEYKLVYEIKESNIIIYHCK